MINEEIHAEATGHEKENTSHKFMIKDYFCIKVDLGLSWKMNSSTAICLKGI